jgi:hypothetical protein
MIESMGYVAACPNCYTDMGTVSDTTTDHQEVAINNVEMTAHVSQLPCEACGTTVFRVQRMFQVVIRA